MEKLRYVKPETAVIIVTDNAPLLSGSNEYEYDITLYPEKDPQVTDDWKWTWQNPSEAD